MAALPPYVGPLGRAWHYGFYLLCGLVLLFLITPILVIVPLSFNAEPYFTYPMPGLVAALVPRTSGRADMWRRAIRNSLIIGGLRDDPRDHARHARGARPVRARPAVQGA